MKKKQLDVNQIDFDIQINSKKIRNFLLVVKYCFIVRERFV
jgi:hypothetical protein